MLRRNGAAGWWEHFRFNIVLGVLLAYMSNFYIETFHLGMQQWRWQLGVAGVPAALFLVMLLTIGRSRAGWS